jgi:hypothetical protein
MHLRVRQEIQARLEPTLIKQKAERHQGLADWYVKLIRSCSSPHAALESLNHRLRCFQEAEAGHSARNLPDSDSERLCRTAMIEARDTLRRAREAFMSCGYFGAFQNVVSQIARDAEDDRSFGGAELARDCRELLLDYCRNVTKFDPMPQLERELDGRPAPATQPEAPDKHALEALGTRDSPQTVVPLYS